MKQEDESPDFEQDLGDDGDVEILEVVGVDEHVPATAVPAPEGSRGSHEVVLTFEEAKARFGDRPPEQEQLMRLRADYENLRKRIDRERQDYEQHANSTLVTRLLPVLDNFERALNLQPRTNGEMALRDGLALIYKHLIDELRREGLTGIEALGQVFDPTLHDAVATDHASALGHNVVVEELQRGYLFRNRVLRPALVKVSVHGPDPKKGT